MGRLIEYAEEDYPVVVGVVTGRPCEVAKAWEKEAKKRGPWTGPLPGDLERDGVTLRASVPPSRWPYGPPEEHQEGCELHGGGLFCDCDASAEEED